jgi:hypothetical protein
MGRAVAQENRSLSSSLSNNKRKAPRRGKCCLLLVLSAPLFFVLLIMYVLSMYNAMVAYEQQSGHLMHTAEQDERQMLRKREMKRLKVAAVAAAAAAAAAEEANTRSTSNSTKKGETLVLTTKHGSIRIVMRPDLSQGSVDYIHRLMDNGVCSRCNLYRAEKPGILQGVMANKKEVQTNEVKGSCPTGMEDVNTKCPVWDKSCGCHGPVMTKGMVAWAGGRAGGPDFFIDNYKRTAQWWGTQNTNFGQIQDDASFQVVKDIFELPITYRSGMNFLNNQIHFDMSLE